jgi:hypothetical protein
MAWVHVVCIKLIDLICACPPPCAPSYVAPSFLTTGLLDSASKTAAPSRTPATPVAPSPSPLATVPQSSSSGPKTRITGFLVSTTPLAVVAEKTAA